MALAWLVLLAVALLGWWLLPVVAALLLVATWLNTEAMKRYVPQGIVRDCMNCLKHPTRAVKVARHLADALALLQVEAWRVDSVALAELTAAVEVAAEKAKTYVTPLSNDS